nr:JAB domain-containing protein [uncultured Sphingosinicella sp.]
MPTVDQLFPTVRTARDAANLIAPALRSLKVEKLVVLHLDGARRLLGLMEGPAEAPAGASLPIRAVVADALRFESAAIVIGHNHPSGDPAPSRADIEATRRLATVLAELEIALHDHLIFTASDVCSFRALGLL